MATVFSTLFTIFGGRTNVCYSRQREIGKESTAAQEENRMKVDDPFDDSGSNSDFDSDSDFYSDSDSDSDSKLFIRESQFEYHLINCLEHWDLDKFEAFMKSGRQNHAMITLKSILHNIDVHDKENFKKSVTQALSMSIAGIPPLYHFAINGGFRLTALFLEHGEDPNIRIPTVNEVLFPNMMLPLNAALCYLAFGLTECDLRSEGAAVRLICCLCYASQMQRLETARLLASKTKELDQEICTYMVLGRVRELCALMLLGYHSRVSFLLNCCNESSKELMEQLVDIFNRVGDKLVYYVKLQRLKGVDNDRVNMDIALLCKDVDYQVRSKYIISIRNDVHLFRKTCRRKSYSGIGHYVGDLYYSLVLNSNLLYDDFRTWRRMFRDVIRGSCSLNASSISRTHKVVEHYYLSNNFTRKGLSLPCSPPFLLRVLRRATRI